MIISFPQRFHMKLGCTKDIPKPNVYIQKLYGEYAKFTYDEISAEKWKGLWRKEVFNNHLGQLHLEIGTGTGFHIAQQAHLHPEDSFIGIELKYKPLIQSIRRARKQNSENVRLIRYNACQIENLFKKNELNNIYIHFPDPWPKRRQKKHQLITPSFIDKISFLQNKKGIVELKTDCQEYFIKSHSIFKNHLAYKEIKYSLDLHSSDLARGQIITTFESIFIKKNQPIYFMQWIHI